MKLPALFLGTALLLVAGCAQTDIQPLTQDTFKVATTAAPACGPAGARRVANNAAAIEVIKRGYDKFVFEGDQSQTYAQGDVFTGVRSSFQQGMIVRLIPEGSPEARNALSARTILGPDWEEVVAKGVRSTC